LWANAAANVFPHMFMVWQNFENSLRDHPGGSVWAFADVIVVLPTIAIGY
jgi:hypothetical protein